MKWPRVPRKHITEYLKISHIATRLHVCKNKVIIEQYCSIIMQTLVTIQSIKSGYACKVNNVLYRAMH